MTTCIHCGTPFVARREDEHFCCAGCAYVHELIQGQNLNRYYDLRAGPVPPVGNRVFHPGRHAWLAEIVQHAEAADKPLTLRIQGLSCAACVWLVEQIFLRQPGALQAMINASTGRVRLRWEAGRFDAVAFAGELNRFGYSLGPDDGAVKNENAGLATRIGLCGAFAMNAMLFTLPHYLGLETTGWLNHTLDAVALACSTLSMLVGGSYFIRRAWASLRSGLLHIDLPIALGLIVAYTATVFGWLRHRPELAYFDFVSIFTVLMLTGRWLQERIAEENRNRLLGVSALPGTVECLAGNETVRVPLTELRSGMRLRIEPGGVIPVRSRLLETKTSGTSLFGLEWICGESEPREFTNGSVVPSGSFNLERESVELETLETWNDSLLRALTEEPEAMSAAASGLNQIIRLYLGIVLLVATLGGAAWWFAGRADVALQVIVSTLVISCPCAIGISLPLADEMATAFARRLGCFVRNSTLWRRLRRVSAVAFDKTGTLTLDVPQLRDSGILASLRPEDRGALEAMVSASLHPVGKSLREALLISNLPRIAPVAPYEIGEVTGAGVSLNQNKTAWRLGRPEWIGSDATTAECVFDRDGKTLAVFSFVETLRPESKDQVDRLQQRGYAVWLLSGDRRSKVEALARQLDLPADHILAEATPQEKAGTLRRLEMETLMIGDGANDSLAFRQALCSGTPAVDRGLLENRADFYFTGTSLQSLSGLLALADQHSRAVKQVMTFTISYNIIAVGLALAGWIFPIIAAVLMPASAVISLFLVAWSFNIRTGQYS